MKLSIVLLLAAILANMVTLAPLVVLLALIFQPRPSAAIVIDYTDDEYLAFLLAQGVRRG